MYEVDNAAKFLNQLYINQTEGEKMKQQTKKLFDPNKHEKMLQNVAGTMAIEGLALSKASKRNLERYAKGEANYQQIMTELYTKYQKAK